jgi:uncharacterized membrane protein YgaE (UPF0421/DUF939 family)
MPPPVQPAGGRRSRAEDKPQFSLSNGRTLDIAMNTEIDVRRDERGFIDIAFYKRRAERLRRQAIIELTASVRELLSGWLRRRRPAAQDRLVKP